MRAEPPPETGKSNHSTQRHGGQFSRLKATTELGKGSLASPFFSLPNGMFPSVPKEPYDTEKTEDSNEKGVTVVYNAHIDVSSVDEAKLVRKMDWWLLPWLSFLHLLSFLDRVSIGNAKVRQSAPPLSVSLGQLIVMRP